MNQEKTATEILEQFAKRTGRMANINVHEQEHKLGMTVRNYLHSRQVYFPENPQSHIYYVASSDPQSFGLQEQFSGVFMPFDCSQETEMTIRKKIVIDKFNIFGSKDHLKTGNRAFNKKALIKSNNQRVVSKFAGDTKVQQTIKVLFENYPLYRIVINRPVINFVSAFRSVSYIGIVRHNWELNEKTIEQLFRYIQTF